MKRIILKNASIYMNGTIIAGSLIIYRKKIHKIINEGHSLPKRNFFLSKTKTIEIDCEKRLILPGLIDVHAHLRDMGQSEKETFFTATKAAAFNGITTVFNMPNTSPPAITYKQIESWLKKAKKNIFIDVGFIAGVPPHFDEQEVKRIIKKRIFGFKIYPHNSINGIDWTDTKNLQHILKISSKFNIPIFFHSEWPNLSNNYDTSNNSTSKKEVEDLLNLHDKLKPLEAEYKYLKFVIENYFQYIKQNPTHPYPFIHLCHISSKLSYDFIQQIQALNKNYKISMEVTPHHLLLNKSIQLLNPKIAKVDPPLRDSKEQQYLYDQFVKGDIKI